MFLLILSHSEEPLVKAILTLSSKLNSIKPILFEKYRNDHQITCAYHSGKFVATLHIEGKSYELNSNNFPVVWSRLKVSIDGEIPGNNEELNQQFCISEWRSAHTTLQYFLQDSKWVNPIPTYGRQASRKILQLKIANEVDLIIPETVISNRYSDILPLFDDGDVVFKSLSGFGCKQGGIFTNQISRRYFKSKEKAIPMAPSIYQRMLEKDHELRVTIINDEIFTTKIYSQKSKDSQVDWRRGFKLENIQPGKLSATTSAKLLKFHKYFNLIYAAYDFVVDNQGNEIFLECNPGGQCLWHYNNTEYSPYDALINELSNPKRKKI